MSKIKLLILQNEISAYNVEMFNIIAQKYCLTVGYYEKDNSKIPCSFEKRKFAFRKIGPVYFLKGLRKFAQKFDVVSFVPDFHVVSYCALPFLPHNYKLINWSIGFRVSYTHPYVVNRNHNLLDRLFRKVQNKCDASIYYMEKAKEFWRQGEIDMNRVFVAPNTTSVLPIEIKSSQKQFFLFVGTLYKGKGLDVLLSSYLYFVHQTKNPIPLIIVGDGEERENLQKYVEINGLDCYVKFTGAIYEEKVLANYFSKSILCFSPNQAGLSVPKSMGYGVPFVTRKDAITGGEMYHITPGINGILYDDDEEILQIMLDASENLNKYIKMGNKAKDYYDNYATVTHMARGAINAIDFVQTINN